MQTLISYTQERVIREELIYANIGACRPKTINSGKSALLIPVLDNLFWFILAAALGNAIKRLFVD